MKEIHPGAVEAPANWGSITDYLPPPWAIWTAAALSVPTLIIITVRAARALWRAHAENRPLVVENALTVAAACIATGVSAQGMWRFSGDVLGLDGPLRLLLFAFIEVAIVTSAVRARRTMRENYSAGVDGVAVWALTCLTSVLSSMDARSAPEAVFRLAAPLVAAWLWERGMRIERHRIRGTGQINWRLTPERVLVRLGLAEASDRTAGEVDAHRRITRVAKATERVRRLRNTGGRKLARAEAAFYAALDGLMEHTDLVGDPALQRRLLDQVSTWIGGGQLTRLHALPVWARTAHPAVPIGVTPDDAQAALDQLARWDSAEARQRALDRAALTVMDGGLHHAAPDVSCFATAERFTPQVTRPASATVPPGAGATRGAASPVVTPQVAEEVAPRVAFDVTDPAVYDIRRQLQTPLPVTSSVVAEEVTKEPDDATKTQRMRVFWNAEVAAGRYPRAADLAAHAGAHPSLASRLRRTWVAELPWRQRRKANPEKTA